MFLTFLTELLFDVCLHQKDKFTVRRLTLKSPFVKERQTFLYIYTSFYFIFTHFNVCFLLLEFFFSWLLAVKIQVAH